MLTFSQTFLTGRKCLKRLENLHILVFGCANHNALCENFVDKYFLSYDGFFLILTGKSRYRVLKHGVGVEWDPRRTTA